MIRLVFISKLFNILVFHLRSLWSFSLALMPSMHFSIRLFWFNTIDLLVIRSNKFLSCRKAVSNNKILVWFVLMEFVKILGMSFLKLIIRFNCWLNWDGRKDNLIRRSQFKRRNVLSLDFFVEIIQAFMHFFNYYSRKKGKELSKFRNMWCLFLRSLAW